MQTMDDILKGRSKIAKTNICYMDDEGNVVEKDKATKCIITEYDDKGNIINENFMAREKGGEER